MAKITDLSQSNMGEPTRQAHRDRYATKLNGSSVGHGGQRFYGTGKLRVENEGLEVIGVANISGTLNVGGTSTFTGATNLNGPTSVAGSFTVTGPTHLNGVTDVAGAFTVTGLTKLQGNTTVSGTLDVTGAMATKGTLSVEGVTTLKNDLNVTTGGKITLGEMKLVPSSGVGGRIEFDNGSTISSESGMSMKSSSGAFLNLAAGAKLSSEDASISFTMGLALISAVATTITGPVSLPSLGTTSGKTSNVYLDPVTKQLQVIT